MLDENLFTPMRREFSATCKIVDENCVHSGEYSEFNTSINHTEYLQERKGLIANLSSKFNLNNPASVIDDDL